MNEFKEKIWYKIVKIDQGYILLSTKLFHECIPKIVTSTIGVAGNGDQNIDDAALILPCYTLQLPCPHPPNDHDNILRNPKLPFTVFKYFQPTTLTISQNISEISKHSYYSYQTKHRC